MRRGVPRQLSEGYDGLPLRQYSHRPDIDYGKSLQYVFMTAKQEQEVPGDQCGIFGDDSEVQEGPGLFVAPCPYSYLLGSMIVNFH